MMKTGRYCVNPPFPPAENKINDTTFSLSNLPEIGEKVRYKCEAGGHNKLKGDFSKNYFDILCEDNNTMEAPAAWPVCLAGKKWSLVNELPNPLLLQPCVTLP